jgi:glutaredoxin
MTENFNSLFQYLEKEEISIDKSEFLFQIQSHPDYPSSLSINDTLNFFNIQNGLLKVDISQLELLPNQFATFLNDDRDVSQLYFIEKKGNDYFYNQDKKTKEISASKLQSKWNDVVLLVQKSENEVSKKIKNNNTTLVLSSLSILFFLWVLFQSEESLLSIMFFIFPIIGILFSIAAHKDLFGTKSAFINKFCNISTTTSCSTIIGSNKWKIFSFINLSDLSIVFYSSQLITFFAFILTNNTLDFFNIQKILLFLSIPVLLLSVYYQKFIEKKWCPICLAIITVLFSEILYLISFKNTSLNITFQSITIFGFIFLTIAFVWSVLKNTLNKQKELIEFQLIGNRFMRNYDVFKSLLIKKDKIELPYSPFILGNKESNTEITIITNPFCGYCKDAHDIMDKILFAHKSDIKVKLIISIDISLSDDEIKAFVRSLMAIYLDNGEEAFLESLNYWFENKDLKDWLSVYKTDCDQEKIDTIYNSQKQWCKDNHFTFTPAIFVNSYQFPKTYSREYLEFFVNDLIEDNF